MIVIDHLGREQGMERWHSNFYRLASEVFKDLKIYSNYNSEYSFRKFHFSKQYRVKSVLSILWFNITHRPGSETHVLLAHYGDSFNTILYLPALLKYTRRKRFLLLHDAESTIKKERIWLLQWVNAVFDFILFNCFDQIIVHNSWKPDFLHGKQFFYLPLPPGPASILPGPVLVPTQRFLCWGFIKKSKNIEFILQLAKLMPDSTFEIYGSFLSKKYRQEFLDYFNREGGGNIRFTEVFLQEGEIEGLLQQFDAVLLPYTFINNSGILQANADFGAVTITSSLPLFEECNDISVNLPLDIHTWKSFLVSLDAEKIGMLKQKIEVSNQVKMKIFVQQLEMIRNKGF